jgi:ParB family chromosome partitioning protein
VITTAVVSVNPFRCRMWVGHERLEDEVNEESCGDEIESFKSHGQLIPVLGRPVTDDMAHDFELIYGARRLYVARHLGISLLLQVVDMSDREAIVAMDIENRQRKEFSPYERGRTYNAWLRAGFFSSQDELARELKLSPSQLSRLLRIAHLPSLIVSAFGSAIVICESWGRDLMALWDDPIRRRDVIAAARALLRDHPRPPPATVYQKLVSSSGSVLRRRRGRLPENYDEVVKSDVGDPLFRVRVRRRDVALLLPCEAVTSDALRAIKAQVTGILQRARLQPVEFNGDCFESASQRIRRTVHSTVLSSVTEQRMETRM